jgi:S-adenosylmethionine:tRNA ribosyltransferase-isomerase
VTTSFTLPPDADATEPPEWQGLERDEVRLMAVRPGTVTTVGFRDLPGLLEPGDLVVVNTSATLPGRLDARRADGVVVPLHWSTTLDDGTWVVEVRRPRNDGPDLGVEPGSVLDLPDGVRVILLDGFPDPARPGRLWRARTEPHVTTAYLERHGRPIGYRHLTGAFPLTAFQNVYAREPGSAEMASAGRPLTARVLTDLVARGIPIVPVTLHTGVSSPELHEPPSPERFAVPEVTARLVNVTREAGGRVIAVGTTVVRALETATDDDGVTRAAAGWTDVVLGPDRSATAVTGLLTGLHEPGASHLRLLEAVAGDALVQAAYAAAVAEHYRWHEFGDSMLFLPQADRAAASSSARRSSGGRRGQEVHSDPPGSRSMRQHDPLRVNRAAPTST